MGDSIDRAIAVREAEEAALSFEDRLARDLEDRQRKSSGQTGAEAFELEQPIPIVRQPGGVGIDRPGFTGTTPAPSVSLTDKQRNLGRALAQYLRAVAEGELQLDDETLNLIINGLWNEGQKIGMQPTDISWAIAFQYNTWGALVGEASGMRLLEPQPLLLGVDGGTHPGTGAQLSWWTAPDGLLFEPFNGVNQDTDNPGNPFSGLGFGGGFGAGIRLYARPDEDEVRDIVRQKLKILVGGAEDNRVERGLRTYMAAHRANFDRETIARAAGGKTGTVQSVNPLQSVTEEIRTYGDYKQIHDLRPTDLDEDDWLTTGIGFSRAQEGVTEQEATRRGIVAARSGDVTSQQDVFARSQKRQLPTFFDKAATNAASLGRSIK